MGASGDAGGGGLWLMAGGLSGGGHGDRRVLGAGRGRAGLCWRWADLRWAGWRWAGLHWAGRRWAGLGWAGWRWAGLGWGWLEVGWPPTGCPALLHLRWAGAGCCCRLNWASADWGWQGARWRLRGWAWRRPLLRGWEAAALPLGAPGGGLLAAGGHPAVRLLLEQTFLQSIPHSVFPGVAGWTPAQPHVPAALPCQPSERCLAWRWTISPSPHLAWAGS